MSPQASYTPQTDVVSTAHTPPDETNDEALDCTQLQAKYDVLAKDGKWGEHPRYKMAPWRADVADKKTLLGYWAWVVAQYEGADDGQSAPEKEAAAEKEEVTELQLDDPGNQGS